jgi:hypothetical protein
MSFRAWGHANSLQLHPPHSSALSVSGILVFYHCANLFSNSFALCSQVLNCLPDDNMWLNCAPNWCWLHLWTTWRLLACFLDPFDSHNLIANCLLLYFISRCALHLHSITWNSDRKFGRTEDHHILLTCRFALTQVMAKKGCSCHWFHRV